MDAQEYLDASENVKYEDIDSPAWAFYTIDGTLRGYPYEGAISVWLCNSEIFEKYNLEYPKTMDDVKELAKTFSENGIITLAIGSSGGNPGHFFVSDLINQIPGGMEEIQNFGSTAKFATDASLKAAQTILDLREAGVFPQDTVANSDWTPAGELYNSGKAAMVFTYNWVVTSFDEELLEKSVIIDTPKIDDVIIFLAAMQSIDASIFESTLIDGANAFQQFTLITCPLVKATIFTSLVLCFTGSMKSFDIPFIMTAGGPGTASSYLGNYMYKAVFSSGKFGRGSAVAVVIMMVSFAFTLIFNTITRERSSKGGALK